jgi:hypothetical protein
MLETRKGLGSPEERKAQFLELILEGTKKLVFTSFQERKVYAKSKDGDWDTPTELPQEHKNGSDLSIGQRPKLAAVFPELRLTSSRKKILSRLNKDLLLDLDEKVEIKYKDEEQPFKTDRAKMYIVVHTNQDSGLHTVDIATTTRDNHLRQNNAFITLEMDSKTLAPLKQCIKELTPKLLSEFFTELLTKTITKEHSFVNLKNSHGDVGPNHYETGNIIPKLYPEIDVQVKNFPDDIQGTGFISKITDLMNGTRAPHKQR